MRSQLYSDVRVISTLKNGFLYLTRNVSWNGESKQKTIPQTVVGSCTELGRKK